MSRTWADVSVEGILRGLNERQREAVECTSGPLLVIAGPGSGKTRVLTCRIAYLIATGVAYPRQILALTFTNKAAREMQKRVLALLPEGAGKGVAMGTFHAVMARMLRVELRHGWLKGFTHQFSIYDTDDSERVLRHVMEDLRMDKKKVTPRTARAIISSAKNKLVSPDQFAEQAKTPVQKDVAQLYPRYLEALRGSNALDFDDLLIKPLELFRREPELLQKYQSRWRHVHIDEYQDTNRVQYLLADMIADRHRNLCVVGDDAQSIYAFRGADMRNILDFHKDYPEATVVRLEQNYRSTKRIVALADSVIKNNKNQLRKNLWTGNADGDAIRCIEAQSDRDEAARATDLIREHHSRHGYRYSDCAILYRTNAQSRSFEDTLRAVGVPYRVVGGLSFYQRKEIKDALAYLRLLINTDDATSLRRIINYPTRGIGLKTQEKLFDHARFHGIAPWAALEQTHALPLGTRARNALAHFYRLIADHRAQMGTLEPSELARNLLMETGLLTELTNDGTESGQMRLQNVQELISAIAEFSDQNPDSDLSAYLQSIALLTDADEGPEDADRVTLMTLHASKGLEFKMVFIGGVEEYLLPTSRAMEADNPDALEEERRLFFVGVTRAERHLYLSHARSRNRFGTFMDAAPSSFLKELDPSLLKIEGRPLRGAGGRQYHASMGTTRSMFGGARGYGSQGTGRRSPAPGRTTRRPAAPASHRQALIDAIQPAMAVEHPNFGRGRVLAVSGYGMQKTAKVRFAGRGEVKLRLSHARLRVVD